MRQWLKEARASKGLTMKTLSEKLDISESYYCAIEGGTRQARMDMALASRLSMVLDMPLDQIADFEEQQKEIHNERISISRTKQD